VSAVRELVASRSLEGPENGPTRPGHTTPTWAAQGRPERAKTASVSLTLGVLVWYENRGEGIYEKNDLPVGSRRRVRELF
jgi:hypothetical protein